MKFVSIGCNCASALSLRELGKRKEAYPFDWVPNTLGIVIDCLLTRFRNYGRLNESRLLVGVNEELRRFQKIIAPAFPPTHINYYNNWFPHYVGLPASKLKEQIDRRVGRFLGLLGSSEDITFAYSNEHAIYLREYLVGQPRYYQNLLTLDGVIRNCRKNFRIVGAFVNETFPETERVKPCRVDWDRKKMSGNGEFHRDAIILPFRDSLTRLLKTVL